MVRIHKNLRFASLFCGCGGFDLGFQQAGFNCAAAYDIDPAVIAVHRANLASPADVCDLSNGTPLGHLRGVDVLLAGPPCQGFSTAGKRELDDPRNHLLLKAGKIALTLTPTVFIVENVTGVTKGKHKRYWHGLHEMLRDGGYRTTDIKCDVTRIGLAQTRTRMVMIAWNNGRDFQPVLPVCPPKTLAQALAGIDADAPNHVIRPLDPSGNLARIAPYIKSGQKLCNVRGGPRSVHTWHIADVFGKTTAREREILEAILRLRRQLRKRAYGDADPVGARDIQRKLGYAVKPHLETLVRKGYVKKVGKLYDLSNTFNGKLRRLAWDAPSYTVDTRFSDPRYFLYPDENRGFTHREAARIQGFPDSFVFEGSERAKESMIGNAVPPPLGKYIADLIRVLLSG